MKVVYERKFGKWLNEVTKDESTIDRVRYRGLVRGHFLNCPSPLLTNHVGSCTLMSNNEALKARPFLGSFS